MKINQKQAAEHLGVKVRTLEDYRLRGGGPTFYKLGARVVYDTVELDGWLAARRRISTSDPGPKSVAP